MLAGLRQRPYTTRRVLLTAGVFVITAVALLVSHAAFAQVNNAADTTIPSAFGLGTNTDIRLAIVRVVQYLLGFLGLVAVIIVLYAGYLWMTAAGNERRIELAKQVLRNGLIGLAIILAAYALVAWVIATFLSTAGNGGNGTGSNPNGPCTNCLALGGGIIADHYPGRDQTGVPRNTKVTISFTEKIWVDTTNATDADSLIWNAHETVPGSGVWTGDLNTGVFHLSPTGSVNGSGIVPMTVATNDRQTFVFTPVDASHNRAFLGNDQTDTPYIATVTSALHKEVMSDGSHHDCGFGGVGGACSGEYDWNFTVSTVLDVTPPQIVDVRPLDTSQNNVKNTAILITFSEPVNPLSATGQVLVDAAGHATNFTNLIARATTANTDVSGRFSIGNGYRSVYFLSDQACGVNTCGQTMYCLPGNDNIGVTVKAATLLSQAACTLPKTAGDVASAACSPMGQLLYDGVVDMADNALAGHRNENATHEAVFPTGHTETVPLVSHGPSDDTFNWSFGTSDVIASTGPKALGVTPSPDTSGISTTDPLTIHFNRTMLPLHNFPDPAQPKSSLPPIKIMQIDSTGAATPTGGFSTTEKDHTNANNADMCSETNTQCDAHNACNPASVGSDANICGQMDVIVNHSPFADTQDYEPRLGSGIQDITQNCFAPPKGPAPNSLNDTTATPALPPGVFNSY